MIRVCHIITGLAADGAERALSNLLTSMDRERFLNEVISLTTIGELGPQIQDSGIRVRAIGLRKGPSALLSLWHLREILKNTKPEVVQTWMYHSDLVGGLAARAAHTGPVLWGIHHTDLQRRSNKFSTYGAAKICAWLSCIIPEKIVCCSESARVTHQSFGYSEAKTEVIPNGFDTSRFRPNSEARKAVLNELGIPAGRLVIVMSGRYHPHKDHATFLAAAESLAKRYHSLSFVLCGRHVDTANYELMRGIRNAGLEGCTTLLGTRSDMERIFAAADIAASSSATEAFPLAVGEAMATGVPCVVTDVGDSAFLVGKTGYVAPARNPEALATELSKLVSAQPEERRQLGLRARHRIEQYFSLPAIVRRYEDLYAQVARN